MEYYHKNNKSKIPVKYQRLVLSNENQLKSYKKILNRIDVKYIRFNFPLKTTLTKKDFFQFTNNSLKQLLFVDCSQPLVPGLLPEQLQDLVISYNYKKPLTVGCLPSGLTDLQLFYNSHALVPGIIPTGVQRLVIGGNFIQPLLPGCIPNSVTDLTIGSVATIYKKPITPDIIPSTIKKLTFSSRFDQVLEEGTIPMGVESVFLGIDYNQPLQPGSIPKSCKILLLGFKYNHRLTPGILPSNLTCLGLGFTFNQPLTPECIPSTITHIYYDGEINIFKNYIPPNLKRIIFTKLSLYQTIFRDPIFNSIQLFKINSSELSKYMPI
ncbi:hypothetical protein DLAC_06310 [Tieghemostelium lacteum]|uniref:FNIP repeat-containing protein n=1 Tax=Tieghemostelium lacteum TaxID=361077 RepID=A0A151ZEJ3_TIELA|nr:hypothetical protein DLAC_06310 [Tieghemostelium lacteum]|eukprot:KYQ92347.1 hypothetical protein DLAC_06310 [Tieghemostelium lacteum]